MEIKNENENENENENKKISIIGTNNRYQIKKMIQPKIDKKRKGFENINQVYSCEKQKQMISLLLDASTLPNESSIFLKEMKHKISSYKQQDILKKLYDPLNFINLKEIILLLDACNLNCYYCSQQIYILYEKVRENMQWTLDRIDNDKGHNKDNVIISCLGCNLKRRTKSKDAFLFTKTFKIIRKE